MLAFSEMALPASIQKSLTRLQFSNPTPIQSAVIPLALDGKDVIACAETGSGKTGAYSIPMIAQLLEDSTKNALILAPTRELVHQISEFVRLAIKDSTELSVTSLVGGADMGKQLQALKRRPRIIVATPGRLIDHLKRKSCSLAQTRILVLDEGDRMLDMGFAPQLDEILRYLPKERQTSLFTATLPKRVQALAEKYLIQPKFIQIGEASKPVAAIDQKMLRLKQVEKEDRILDELNQRTGSVIIFTRTKQRTDSLARHLNSYGYAVDLIHGGLSQGQRNRALQNFRQGRSRILCATDVAARGLDVPQVEHVINYDLPMMSEDYVHRIGRTGRNGAKGEALSFVATGEERNWNLLVKKYGIEGATIEGQTGGGGRQGGKYGGRSSERSAGRGEGYGGGGSRGARSSGGRSRTASASSSYSRGEERPFGRSSAMSSETRSEERSFSRGPSFDSAERKNSDWRPAAKPAARPEWKSSESNGAGDRPERKKFSRSPKKPFASSEGRPSARPSKFAKKPSDSTRSRSRDF